MFEYSFMRISLVAIIMISFILPLLGVNVTTKRLSMIGDTLSHTALAGIAIGLAVGTGGYPIPWAIGVSVISGAVIELVRLKFKQFSELTLAIVMSAAVGFAGIMTTYVKGNNFEKYLFGSIITVQASDLYIIGALFVLTLLFSIGFYRTNMYIAFSESEARIAHINVKVINMVMILLVASVVAVASNIIGSLIVSSFLALPVACALQVSKSYFQTNIYAVVFSLIPGVVGLIISWPLNWNVGGAIVLLSVAILVMLLIGKGIFKLINYFSIRNSKDQSN
ncbi:MAG TPA: metal ABC transporter permease [Firmicutes bacterium]|nr:metal ABC transporter permease [Bacillota bacterium]